MNLITQLRKSKTYIDTASAAAIVEKSVEWVRKNKHLFDFKRDTEKDKNYKLKKGKLLRFEISSVLEYWNRQQEHKIESRNRD